MDIIGRSAYIHCINYKYYNTLYKAKYNKINLYNAGKMENILHRTWCNKCNTMLYNAWDVMQKMHYRVYTAWNSIQRVHCI